MKNFKKKLAGLLAAVMTLASSGFTAFAAEGNVVTKYGTVPAEWADKSFAAFWEGEFLGAYEALYEGTSTKSGKLSGAGMIPAVKSYMKNNPMSTTDGTPLEGCKDVQVVMLRDANAHYEATGYSNLAQVRGRIVVDLNGYTLTAQNTIWPGTAKAWGSVSPSVYETNITMKNGNVLLDNSTLMYYYSPEYTMGDYKKHMVFNFEDLNISLVEGHTKEALIVKSSASLVNPGAIFDISFKNCTFDVRNAAGKYSIFNATHTMKSTNINYTVEGGNIIVNDMADVNIVNMSKATTSTIQVLSGNKGLYPTITLPQTAAAPGDVAYGDTTLSYAKYSETDSGNVIYVAGLPGSDAFTFTTDEEKKTAVITGYNAEVMTEAQLKNLVIPEIVVKDETEYTVTEVGGFKSCKVIETLNLPKTLETLSLEAFYGCSALTTVIMPSCKTIGKNAFYADKKLSLMNSQNEAELILPENLVDVESSAFYNCDAIEKVIISSCRKLNHNIFKSCDKLSSMNSDYNGEVILPNGIITLGFGVFEGTKCVKTIVFPKSLTSVNTRIGWKSNVENIVLFPNIKENSNKDKFKTIVGGKTDFETANLFTFASSDIAQFALSEDNVDDFGADDGNASYKKLYNLIPEESETIVYDEKITDTDGTEMGALKDRAGFEARVLNMGTTEQKMVVIMCVTGADDVLKGVSFYEMTMPAYSGKTLTGTELTIENVDFAQGDKISVMIWEDLENIRHIVTREISFDVTEDSLVDNS